MRNIHHIFPLAFISGALLMTGCVPTTSDATPTATACPPIPLVAPQAFTPNGELVSSLQPTFQWFYDAACAESFGLDIAPDGNFNDPGVVHDQTSGPQTTWALSQPLQPASIYKWRVFAKRGFTSGPYSPELWFWTGPICDSNIPDIPELVSPIQGVIVNDASPPLDWIYPAPGCLAPGFRFEVSLYADFHQTALSGSSPSPWTSFETNVDFLQDCNDYYWRVAVLDGNQVGTYSTVEEFSTDFQGVCSAAPALGPEIFAIACIGSQSTLISFEFPERIQDKYEARIGEEMYECELNAERPMLLHCSGPRVESSTGELVELIVIETQEVVLSTQARFPGCAQSPCSGLALEACNARSDCKWVPGPNPTPAPFGGGFCSDN